MVVRMFFNILHYALNCFSEMDMYEPMRRDVRGVGFSKNNGKKKSKQELKDAGVWQRYPNSVIKSKSLSSL